MKIKFFNKTGKVAKQFDKYKAIKNGDELKSVVKRDSFLQKTFHQITLKRVLIGVTATTASVYIGKAVDDYISENSGCFLYTGNDVCKVKELSCCNTNPSKEIPFCKGINFNLNTCKNYDKEKEKICCRKCDCKYHACAPNQTMECKTATVAEALSHFVNQSGSTVLSSLYNAVTSLKFVKIFFIVFGVFIFGIVVRKFV